MKVATAFVICLWVLSLPFYTYSVHGTLSVDNILAPVVAVFSILKLTFYSHEYGRGKFASIVVFLVLFGIYATGKLLSVQGQPDLVKSVAVDCAKQFVYFIGPLCYFATYKEFRRMATTINVATLFGTMSVFLVALGLLHLNLVRVSPSRLDIDLPKSIGLFANYGDLAMLTSFSVVGSIVAPVFKGKIANMANVIAMLCLAVIGYLGAQSRNYLLTLVMCWVAYYAAKHILKKNAAYATLAFLGAIAFSGLVTATLVVSQVNVVGALRGWGGRQAAETADARLQQYTYAWGLIKSSPIIGKGADVVKTGVTIHNIWLNLMATGGLMSTIPIVVLFILLFSYQFVFTRKRIGVAFGAYGCSILFALFVASEFYESLSYTFWILMGIVSAMPFMNADVRRTNEVKIPRNSILRPGDWAVRSS